MGRGRTKGHAALATNTTGDRVERQNRNESTWNEAKEANDQLRDAKQRKAVSLDGLEAKVGRASRHDGRSRIGRDMVEDSCPRPRPSTVGEAMVQSPPNSETERSVEEVQHHRADIERTASALRLAASILEPEQLARLKAVVVDEQSYRETGRHFGSHHNTVRRHVERDMAVVRQELLADPRIDRAPRTARLPVGTRGRAAPARPPAHLAQRARVSDHSRRREPL